MDLLTKAKEFIDREVRPMIQGDGGDIEVVELTIDNILKVRLHGSCVNCASASMTLAFGVEDRIKEALPEISGVIQVS